MDDSKAMRLLESLTPGGSEFFNNPERCAKWIADRLTNAQRLTVDAVARRKEAEANAKAPLMAAAPEMYALLKRMHADLARYAKTTEEVWSSGSIAFGSMADDCARLLAKARGEST